MVSTGDHHEDEREEKRQDDRQSRNGGQDKVRVVLRHRAGPGQQRTSLCPTMMTRVMVAPVMEVKGAGLGRFEVQETGGTDADSHQPDAGKKAGKPQHRLESSWVVHGPGGVVHNENPVKEEGVDSTKRTGRLATDRCLRLLQNVAISSIHKPA